jgi:hypothetical protein
VVVRTRHSEEPEEGHADPEGGGTVWDERIDELGARYPQAVLSFVCPDGFPFAVRVPVEVDSSGRRIHIMAEPVGAPFEPGLACLTAHDHSPDFTWQRNFQVRGDLVRDQSGWSLLPHKLIGGFELPKGAIQRYRANLRKSMRFRKIAKRELARRT